MIGCSCGYIGQNGEGISPPLTDEKALLILPELGGHGIYNILRACGASIEEGALCVLAMSTEQVEISEPILLKYGLRD